MLDDMLTQIEELKTSKTSSKRKSSSSGTTEPKAKKPKQQRVAQNEAATAMHAELRAMGFTSPADFGKRKFFVKRTKELASAETGSESPDACGNSIDPEIVGRGEEGTNGE
ncbi:hypothetical protein WJX77_011058 [Trebouxia sp. C0004]